MEAFLHHVFDVELKRIKINKMYYSWNNYTIQRRTERKWHNFNVGGMYLGSSAVLSLYSIRRMSVWYYHLGYTFPSSMDKDTHTREMKEKFTCVVEDFAE